MASAVSDRGGWRLSFRFVGDRGTSRRRKFIPADKLKMTKAQADRLARKIDDACRSLEHEWDETAVELLVRWSICTEEDLRAALGGDHPVAPRDPRDVSLLEAFQAHPSTSKELARDPESHQRHLFGLREFMKFAGVSRVREVTVPLCVQWVQHMADPDGLNLRYHTRRHRLLGLRRACMMGPHWGVPCVLTGMKIDGEDDVRTRVQSFTEKQLVAMLRACASDPQAYAVIALQACCGLGPSEVYRLNCGDVSDGILHVGARESKNRHRNRRLPLPAVVSDAVNQLLQPGPDAPLIRAPKGGRCDRWQLEHIAKRAMKACGRELQVKCLRKTFATLASRVWKIDRDHLEVFMGHSLTNMSSVTSEHYVSNYVVEELRPTARAINRQLVDAIERPEDGSAVIIPIG